MASSAGPSPVLSDANDVRSGSGIPGDELSSETPNSLLFIEKSDRIGTIVINRPAKRNAFTQAMWVLFGELLGQLESDSQIKVIVIRSSDARAFSAGADITEFRELRMTPVTADVYEEAVRGTEARLAQCSKPTIAMISGYCVGGGCELAVACDFRFAASNATFGITPANIGLIYSLAGTKRLVDVVGPANAKLMLMTGQLFNADRASSMGLVTTLVPEAELREATYEFAYLVASKAKLTVQAAKRMIAMILDGALADNEVSLALQEQGYGSEDYREGVAAFIAGRKPVFS